MRLLAPSVHGLLPQSHLCSRLFAGALAAVVLLLMGLASSACAQAVGAGAKNAPATSGAPTLIILDASGSMIELIKGEQKIDIAKRAIRELVQSLPDGALLGLVVYSHRKPYDCDDIELVIPPSPLNRTAFIAAFAKIKPNGRTPLCGALEFAAKTLDYKKQPANVVLVSDGLDTCGGDPCATASKLRAAGVDFVVHAVAFDLSAKEAKSFACIATNTGGRFLQANDAATLKDALYLAVTEAVVAPPPKAATPTPAPVVQVTLKAAATTLAGAEFPVGWTGPDVAGDYITIVPRGTPETDDGNLAYTRQGSPLKLTALLDPGEAEIRYVLGRTHTVLARLPVKITPIDVSLDAAAEAIAGSAVSITWKGPNNDGDLITIVPAATEDNGYADYSDSHKGSPAKVTAPMQTGSAEIRYLSGQRGHVLGRKPIKILPAQITLTAPDQVVAGGAVDVAWSGPNNPNDYLTIVPPSAPDGSRGPVAYTLAGSPAHLSAPGVVGVCEIRYMSGQGDQVLASRPLATVTAAVTLTAPSEAVTGAAVKVTWTGPNNQNDYVTIVASDKPEGSSGASTYTSNGSPLEVTAPAETGDCEIRYVSGQGDKTLAHRPIKIVEARVSLTPPARVPVGSPVSIAWTGPNNQNDFICIVPKGSPDGTSGKFAWTANGSPLQIEPPDTPGAYEVRYISGQTEKVLARADINFTGMP